MAAHTQFPPPGAQPQVRGDPATMAVWMKADGIDQNITTWTFRCYVRDRMDGTLINKCLSFEVTTPAAVPGLFPGMPASTVPCVLLCHWTADQTAQWASGYVADIEQLTPVKQTPLIFDALRIDPDVSHETGSP